MILDRGICTLYRLESVGSPGNMPVEQLVIFHESWFGELSFASNPEYETDHREDVQVSARIRIYQNRNINNLQEARLSTDPNIRYEVTRVFHGVDEDSGEPISDLSLKVVVS